VGSQQLLWMLGGGLAAQFQTKTDVIFGFRLPLRCSSGRQFGGMLPHRLTGLRHGGMDLVM
jgi:hypothetical protein